MNLNQLTSQSLKKAAILVEEKEALQAKIAEIDQQLTALCSGAPAEPSVEPAKALAPVAKVKVKRQAKAAKHGDLTASIEPPKVVALVAKVKVGRKMKRAKRGALGEAIVNVLKNAGPQGIRLTDIAKSLGVKINNVSAWMASTGKKTKAYKKLQKGVYAWKG